jgi:hypothetical protein
MKTTLFASEHMRPVWNKVGLESLLVPTLSAYAIEFADFTPPRSLDAGHIELVEGQHFRIKGDHVVFGTPLTDPFLQMDGSLSSSRLVIHYHGIRDYRLLFPQVTDESLKVRLGEFYEEGERAFDTGAWLSFALMAAAVYEGILGWRVGKKRGDLVDFVYLAHKRGIVTDDERDILDSARETRNLVHASKHKRNWVSRAQAMDIRKVLDTLVRSLSAPDSAGEPIS